VLKIQVRRMAKRLCPRGSIRLGYPLAMGEPAAVTGAAPRHAPVARLNERGPVPSPPQPGPCAPATLSRLMPVYEIKRARATN